MLVEARVIRESFKEGAVTSSSLGLCVSCICLEFHLDFNMLLKLVLVLKIIIK